MSKTYYSVILAAVFALIAAYSANSEQSDLPISIKIRVALGENGESPTRATLQYTDTLFVEADITETEEPTLSTIRWELHRSRVLQPNFTKTDQVYRKNGTGKHSYVLPVRKLSGGQYELSVSFTPIDKPAKAARASVGFSLPGSVKVRKIYASDKKQATTHDQILQHGNPVILFGNFSAPEDIDSIRIRATLSSRSKPNFFDTDWFARESSKQSYKIAVDPDLLPANEKITYTATFATEGGIPQTESVSFTTVPYKLSWLLPSKLKCGTETPFHFKCPSNFNAPFTVRFNAPDSVFLEANPSTGTGTIRTVSTEKDIPISVTMIVVDSRGEMVQAARESTVLALGKDPSDINEEEPEQEDGFLAGLQDKIGMQLPADENAKLVKKDSGDLLNQTDKKLESMNNILDKSLQIIDAVDKIKEAVE